MTHSAIRDIYPEASIINGSGENVKCFDAEGNELNLDLSIVGTESRVEHNKKIEKQIIELERQLLRPMRELLASNVIDKSMAQEKIDKTEIRIQSLRAEMKGI